MTPARQQDGYGSIGFIPVVRRWWWLLVLSAAIAGVCAYFITRSTSPGFESRTQLLVGPVNTDTDTIRAAGQLALTYAELARSTQVVDSTIDQLGLQMTATDISNATTVTANADTRVLTIRVETDDPALSQAIANGVAENLQTLTSSGTATRPEGSLTFIDQAAPGESIAASNAFVIALAAVAGFLGMLIIVLVIEYFRGAVRNEDELAEITGAPILGVVSTTGRPGGSARSLVVEANPGSPAASAYRVVAAEIEYSRTESEADLRTVLVLGTQRGEGAGELAANLAAAFARGGRRILLLDADDASGDVSATLGLQSVPTDVVAFADGRGIAAITRFRSSFTPGLEVIPQGALGMIDAIDPRRLDDLVTRVLENYDLLVIAGSPLSDSSSALTWAQGADATVLSAMRDRTKRERIGDAVDSLRLVNAALSGIVMTQSRAFDRFRRKRGTRMKRNQRTAWVQVGGQAIAATAEAAQPADANAHANGPSSVSEQQLRTFSKPHERSGD